jgi:hypothetical protein
MGELMGIRWPGAKPTLSFASQGFVPDLSGRHIAGGLLVSER